MNDIDINEIINISRKAGKEILEIYDKDFNIEYKQDKSPLTEADKSADEIITNELKRICPEIPVLSEESNEVDYEERKNWDLFWLVDPLDGTKEFIKKNGEFTVNIALIKENKPILGVVHAPVLDITYYGDKQGSFKRKGENAPERLPIKKEKGKLRVVASKSHFNDETKKFIHSLDKDYELINAGSSLKLCLVAEGKADIYPRLGPTMEWDTAAAHAIVKYADKNVVDYESKEELSYNKKELLNPWFIVE